MRFIRQPNGQVKALTTFTLYDGRTITAGTLGGFIASPRNLSQSGTAWVFPNGTIEGYAYVSGNALVASGGEVLGNAKVYGNATIDNNGTVSVIFRGKIPAFLPQSPQRLPQCAQRKKCNH